MTIYARFDENNNLISFMNKQLSKDIPVDAIEISDELHRSYINNQGRKTIDKNTLILIDRPEILVQDKINSDINTLLVEFNKFSLAQQRQFADLKKYVISDMRNNNYDDAYLTIQTWDLKPEYEPIRQQFLDKFNSLRAE